MEKNNTEIKQKIYWVGEHSFDIYKSTDPLILNNFDNQLLLFSRTEAIDNQNESIVYLDEFYPMMEREYVVSDLQKPVAVFLKDRNISFETGLIIGDASERLVQTVVSVGSFENIEIKEINVLEEEFALANKIKANNEFNMVDVSGFSILFLKEAMPFKDELENANVYKGQSTKTFQNVLNVANSEFKMNEFLYHLDNGVEEAVELSNGVEYFNKKN